MIVSSIEGRIRFIDGNITKLKEVDKLQSIIKDRLCLVLEVLEL